MQARFLSRKITLYPFHIDQGFMTILMPHNTQTDQSDKALEAAKQAFQISLASFSTDSDHLAVITSMQEIVKLLLTQKHFAEALKEIEQLRGLAGTHKKIKIAMLELKGHIKQVGARSGFRSRATKKFTARKPKNPSVK